MRTWSGGIDTEKYIKRWMQALALAAVFMMCPVSVLWEHVDTEAGSRERDSIRPQIALTFDDGPNAQYTPLLLDGLKERDVKASFFVIGANIEKDGNEGI